MGGKSFALTGQERDWVNRAVQKIEADFNRSADTHLLRVPLPGFAGISFYLKDESTHPTGSLKHRLARSLFLYALCNGWVGPKTTIIESSSGSTAVSEAYLARLLGLPFVAVVPRSTSPEKLEAIRFHGGRCHLVAEAAQAHDESLRLAEELGGHYMDQFTYAERATDWRGNNSIAESIYRQMALETDPIPGWIVCGAGTGGTSATIGRYIRYRGHGTRLCLADPASSVFHRHLNDPLVRHVERCCSVVEGIGRPRVEASFEPALIDRCEVIDDVQSLAAARVLSAWIGRPCGGSTGTNAWACARVISGMAARGERGSVVSLLCDSGDRYQGTYFNDHWLEAGGFDIAPVENQFRAFLGEGMPIEA
ncbi:pyridoxal-5'-phosphate-dependent protein subunit beta [Neoasaia chiangmaiensis NBRC 101099]|uniref:L-cysteine desulfhydrase Cds1 n=1 Tax=Neoasaia chiangmaiensis TaxID=320497 RepID=A0A1U9KPL2_9PROT|nr:PLP-dependent cysteine synthase family protein [Neoasaia chiangmaiensis]AQS87640.1 cysteine synthase [Neoasaia chiangmaiensis]GBR42020.1 pyridoxal-5'-phosphate-dependent protein subunit beta [Neoasaia chiangmaiensis NBRC 101099]GEN14210.1 cysteine synthase [Neoasaia chiangmaiensis]